VHQLHDLRLTTEYIIKHNAKIFSATLFSYWLMIYRKRQIDIVMIVHEQE